MNRPSVNHIITQAIPALFSPALSSPCGGNSDQEALTYAWGADGKLANFATTIYNPTGSPSQTTTTMSAHWDGDDLLYVVEAGGSNPELYVEKLGYMYLNGTTWTTTIYDRDQSGTAVDRHGGTNSGSSYAWFAQLSLDNVHPYGTAHAKCMGTLGNFSCNGVVTNPPAATAGGSSCGTLCGTLTMSAILDAGREDGYYDGTVSIQGVRAFDPSMNQWTTPDAYSGDQHDPMSQHPYMWNNNNPVQYEDPSGYCPDACVVEGGVAIGVTEIAVAVVFVVGEAAGNKGITDAAGSMQGKINHAVSSAVSAIGAAFSHGDSRLPLKGTPGSTVTRGDGKQTRTYGPDGMPVKDVDTGHDHGAGDPHAHDWTGTQRGAGRPLTPGEQQSGQGGSGGSSGGGENGSNSSSSGNSTPN
jgi:hypothetical protein